MELVKGYGDAKRDNILKSFINNDIEKAEGSRGGKVIGHTRSGKPIYAGAHESHKSFSKLDHLDAAKENDKRTQIDHASYKNEHNQAKINSTIKKHRQERDYHQGEADNFHESEKEVKTNSEGIHSVEHKGSTYNSKPGESKEDFGKRAKTAIKDDHKDDVEIQKGETSKKDPKDEEFKHHRMMAGYHAAMAKSSGDDSLDMNSSSDPDVQTSAKEKSGESQRHTKMMEDHLNKAKDLHDKEKHGEWNDTIPSWKDAMEYGKTHATEVEKTKKDIGAVKDKDEKKK